MRMLEALDELSQDERPTKSLQKFKTFLGEHLIQSLSSIAMDMALGIRIIKIGHVRDLP